MISIQFAIVIYCDIIRTGLSRKYKSDIRYMQMSQHFESPVSITLFLSSFNNQLTLCPTFYTTFPPTPHLGNRYAAIHKQTRDEVISNFFGIFFLFFQSSQVLGNLISSLVFSQEDEDPIDANSTVGDYACGAMYCYSGEQTIPYKIYN